MSNLAQFVGGYGPIASIVNYFSSGGTASVTSLSAAALNNTKEILSGALTSGALSGALVNVSGRGRVNIVTAYAKDATARTIRLQIIIDGVTAFDATSSSVSGPGLGLIGIGSVDGTNGSQVFQPIDFYQSLVVKVASSLTETDKVALGVNYETWS